MGEGNSTSKSSCSYRLRSWEQGLLRPQRRPQLRHAAQSPRGARATPRTQARTHEQRVKPAAEAVQSILF